MAARNSSEKGDDGANQKKPADEVPVTSPRPQVQNYKPKKPKLDIKDFQFVGLRGEVRVKPPG